jgi:hypothetical protein
MIMVEKNASSQSKGLIYFLVNKTPLNLFIKEALPPLPPSDIYFSTENLAENYKFNGNNRIRCESPQNRKKSLLQIISFAERPASADAERIERQESPICPVLRW